MRTVIGIDIGGSTTKIVGMRENSAGKTEMIDPIFVRATDAITSVYGAFGKFTMQNGIALSDIDQVLMTGVGASFIDKPIYSLPCRKVSEFTSVGLGGLYLSGLDRAVVVSMGTGTAFVYVSREGENTEIKYLGGTGVGGGTLLGLSKKILGVDNIDHLEQLCADGDLNKVDLMIKDISGDENFQIDGDITASNFGKLSDMASKSDIALGIANMVAETIAMLGIFAARNYGIKEVVLTGNLTTIEPITRVFNDLEKNFGVKFIVPDNAQFATVIGAALCDKHN
ncbi:MAG: type II pantothenate kinase [Ruminococcaceae bacterium]|nr:type II pantothenate kinase [Oscillospiraceae bacterium]